MQHRRLPVAAHEDDEALALLASEPAEQARALEALGYDAAVVLLLENSCENRCFFCASPGTTDVRDVTPLARIRQRLSARPTSVTALLVGGNDPVLHPEFDGVLELARDAGFRSLSVMTSGLSLDRDRLRRWQALGVSQLAVPIYSTDPRIHDEVCNTHCFDRLERGLAAARDAGIDVALHTVAMRRTIAGLPALARWVATRFSRPLAVAPLREKRDLFDFDAEAVPHAELDAILRALPAGAPVSLIGMPACIAPNLPRGGPPVIELYFRTQRRDFAPACESCTLRPDCPGVVVGELSRRNGEGLTPVSGVGP